MGKLLDKGDVSMSIIEYQRGLVMIAPVREDIFLVVETDQEASTGMIWFMFKSRKDNLATALHAA